MTENNNIRALEHVAVMGGGRWARVLTSVLCDIVPASTQITVHSPHNAESMCVWAAAQSRPICVSADWPSVSNRPDAMIVANAARDHSIAIEWGIASNIPLLIEKPITPSWKITQRLADLASDCNARMTAAHVLSFTRYLENFSKLVLEQGGLKTIEIEWCDPASEHRHGEQKQFDPSLPVYADVLPHIVSILNVLMPGIALNCLSLAVQRGGALVQLAMSLANTPCNVRLERNGDCRKRIIGVKTSHQLIQLDFSTEPGVIITSSGVIDADPDWQIKKRPIACMLTAFLEWVAGGQFDARLDFSIGLQASHLIMQADAMYRKNIHAFLQERLSGPEMVIDEHLRYAFRELL